MQFTFDRLHPVVICKAQAVRPEHQRLTGRHACPAQHLAQSPAGVRDRAESPPLRQTSSVPADSGREFLWLIDSQDIPDLSRMHIDLHHSHIQIFMFQHI